MISVKNLFKGILLLLVFTSSAVFAQQQMAKKTPEERAQTQIKWMQKNLTLTQDQSDKAYDILLRHARQADSDRNNPDGGKANMQQNNKDRDAELQQVLTGAQYQQYLTHVQEMKEKMQERRNNMQEPAGGGQ